jgi:hypothetical protein
MKAVRSEQEVGSMPPQDLRRATFLVLGGAAIVATAVLHGAVNVPHLRGDLVEIGTRPTLLRAVSLVLYFSVIAMFAFGGLVLASSVAMLRGRPAPPAPLWVTAGAYMAFGVVAFAAVSPSVHFLGYSAMGVLVAVGAAPARAR